MRQGAGPQAGALIPIVREWWVQELFTFTIHQIESRDFLGIAFDRAIAQANRPRLVHYLGAPSSCLTRLVYLMCNYYVAAMLLLPLIGIFPTFFDFFEYSESFEFCEFCEFDEI